MMDRRKFVRSGLVVVAGAGAAGAGAAALARPIDDDAALRAAWFRWLATRDAFEALPSLNCPAWQTAAIEEPYWQALDEAEEIIAENRATTPEGVAIKIRLALDTIFPDKHGNDAMRHGRLDELVTDDLGQSERLLIAALHDLNAMSARLGAQLLQTVGGDHGRD